MENAGIKTNNIKTNNIKTNNIANGVDGVDEVDEENISKTELHCYFNDFLLRVSKKDNVVILNDAYSSYPLWVSHLQTILEKRFKKRENDVLTFNYKNTFNTIYNQYAQIQAKICDTLKHHKNKTFITFHCEIRREIKCSCCKQNWFIPRYSHINTCNNCVDCFFD